MIDNLINQNIYIQLFSGPVWMKSNSSTTSDSKSQIKYIRQSALREYQMYKQIIHDSMLSEESSDIALSQQSNFDTTFKSADQQVSSVSLYHDIPQKLLVEPETNPRQLDLLYGQAEKFVLFDSVVIDPELADLEIQELRKNKMLNQSIQKLLQLRHQKQAQVMELKSRKKAEINAKQQANKIYAQLDLKTQQLKSYFDQETWFKQPNQTLKNRQLVLDMIRNQLRREILKKQTKKYELENRKQALEFKQKTTKKQIEEIQKQIKQIREKRKETLRKQKIAKQRQQIQNLQRSIAKMNKILGRTQ